MKKIRKTCPGIGWMEYEVREPLEPGKVFAFLVFMLGCGVLVAYTIFKTVCWLGF